MNFFSIDVETANPDFSSICQIGLVEFEKGSISQQWQSLVDPEDFFDPMNISIHGIEESDVSDAPKFPKAYKELTNILQDNIVVCHTHFDRVAFSQAIEKYNLKNPDWTWLDSARVVRRTWKELSKGGYGLKNVADFLEIEFQHHDALEDARAAGEIMLNAIQESDLSIEEWLDRVELPISGHSSSSSISMDGNPDGPLFGEVVVFTGALSITRAEAAKLAAEAGCEVASTVKKTTTLLVVGDQDISKLAGHKKSSKHRKAEKRIQKGYQIRIVKESDFKRVIDTKY
jgi:DNA polymerase-3 subunit epsilon